MFPGTLRAPAAQLLVDVVAMGGAPAARFGVDLFAMLGSVLPSVFAHFLEVGSREVSLVGRMGSSPLRSVLGVCLFPGANRRVVPLFATRSAALTRSTQRADGNRRVAVGARPNDLQ